MSQSVFLPKQHFEGPGPHLEWWVSPKSPDGRESKKWKTAFAKGLKYFRNSRKCRASHIAFT